MSDSHREKEDRAFEAFVVSQMRRDRDIGNLDDLPELTDEERKAMNKLPSDLIDKLWESVSDEEETGEQLCEDVRDEDLAGAGMNRAEEMDEETRKKIEAARKKINDEIRKKKQEDGDGKA